MKKLKIILNCNYLYYLLLFIILVLYIIYSSIDINSSYTDFNNKKFIITDIESKEYGLKINLKGKEKVLGYYYLDKDGIDKFKSNYVLGNKVIITGKKIEISNNTVPNTFNYKKYLISNKIYNVIEIKKIDKVNSNVGFFYKMKNIFLNRANIV